MVVNDQNIHAPENMSLHDSVAIANEIRYALGMKRSGWWQMSLAIATVTLSDRGKRRRFITGLLVLIVAYFSLGNWPLDSWLSRGTLENVDFLGISWIDVLIHDPYGSL
jgi:hypothetical protein